MNHCMLSASERELGKIRTVKQLLPSLVAPMSSSRRLRTWSVADIPRKGRRSGSTETKVIKTMTALINFEQTSPCKSKTNMLLLKHR